MINYQAEFVKSACWIKISKATQQRAPRPTYTSIAIEFCGYFGFLFLQLSAVNIALIHVKVEICYEYVKDDF